jgi:hypothetical protein
MPVYLVTLCIIYLKRKSKHFIYSLNMHVKSKKNYAVKTLDNLLVSAEWPSDGMFCG